MTKVVLKVINKVVKALETSSLTAVRKIFKEQTSARTYGATVMIEGNIAPDSPPNASANGVYVNAWVCGQSFE